MKNQRQVLHFTHHQKEVFVIQVLITLAVLMVIVFSLYLVVFGKRNLPSSIATVPVSSTQAIVTTEVILQEGVDEQLFTTQPPENIETSKIESLFPSLK